MNDTAHQLALQAIWSEADRQFAEWSKEPDHLREFVGRLPMDAVEREEVRNVVMTKCSWLYWMVTQHRDDTAYRTSERAELAQLAEIAVAAVCRLGGRDHEQFMNEAEQYCLMFEDGNGDPAIRGLLALVRQCIDHESYR